MWLCCCTEVLSTIKSKSKYWYWVYGILHRRLIIALYMCVGDKRYASTRSQKYDPAPAPCSGQPYIYGRTRCRCSALAPHKESIKIRLKEPHTRAHKETPHIPAIHPRTTTHRGQHTLSVAKRDAGWAVWATYDSIAHA